MNESFTPKQIEISFRKFNDYSSDFEVSDHNSFDTHLKILLDHCENDPIMKVITEPLKNEKVYGKWKDEFIQGMGSMVGSSKLNFPIDEYERDSYLYQLLRKMRNNEINLTTLAMRCHGGSSLNEGVYWFNEQILGKLLRSLRYKLEEVQDRIAREVKEGDNVPMNLLFVFQDNSIKIDKNVKIGGDAAIGRDVEIGKK